MKYNVLATAFSFFLVGLAVLFSYPGAALAAPLVPCFGADCNLCQLSKLAQNVIEFIVQIAFIVAALLFAYAGFLYFTSGASADNVTKARSVFTNAFWGIIIVLTAWLIVNVILVTLTGKGVSPFTKILCEGSSSPLPSSDTKAKSGSSGVSVSGSKLDNVTKAPGTQDASFVTLNPDGSLTTKTFLNTDQCNSAQSSSSATPELTCGGVQPATTALISQEVIEAAAIDQASVADEISDPNNIVLKVETPKDGGPVKVSRVTKDTLASQGTGFDEFEEIGDIAYVQVPSDDSGLGDGDIEDLDKPKKILVRIPSASQKPETTFIGDDIDDFDEPTDSDDLREFGPDTIIILPLPEEGDLVVVTQKQVSGADTSPGTGTVDKLDGKTVAWVEPEFYDVDLYGSFPEDFIDPFEDTRQKDVWTPSTASHLTTTEIDKQLGKTKRWEAGNCAQVSSGIGKQARCNASLAILTTESTGNPDRCSTSSCGLMQLKPSTAKALDPVSFAGLTDAQVATKLKSDTDLNMKLGNKYYASLLKTYKNHDLAAAAYNGGPKANGPSKDCPGLRQWQCQWDDPEGTINRRPNTRYTETRDYVAKVRKIRDELNARSGL